MALHNLYGLWYEWSCMKGLLWKLQLFVNTTLRIFSIFLQPNKTPINYHYAVAEHVCPVEEYSRTQGLTFEVWACTKKKSHHVISDQYCCWRVLSWHFHKILCSRTLGQLYPLIMGVALECMWYITYSRTTHLNAHPCPEWGWQAGLYTSRDRNACILWDLLFWTLDFFK